VAGFGATYDTQSCHGAYAQVTGQLTAVPEPIGLALLGLAGRAAGARRRPHGRGLGQRGNAI
jgi:hypothetical protein